jgi:hypothetical protein
VHEEGRKKGIRRWHCIQDSIQGWGEEWIFMSHEDCGRVDWLDEGKSEIFVLQHRF